MDDRIVEEGPSGNQDRFRRTLLRTENIVFRCRLRNLKTIERLK